MTQEPQHERRLAGLFHAEDLLEWPPLEDSPKSLDHFIQRGTEHLDAYYATGRREKLAEWHGLLQRITEDHAYSNAPDIFKAGILYRLGIATQWTAVQFTIDAESSNAIQLWKRAAEITPPSSRLSIRSKYNIAITWVNAYRGNQDPDFLQNAVQLLEYCIHKVDASSPEAALCWEGKSLALDERFKRFGNQLDLDLSLAAAEKSVHFMGESPRAPRYLTRLANVLLDRYDQRAQLEDLDQALDLFAQAETKLEEGTLDWLGFLGEVPRAHQARFEELGGVQDLVLAIDMNRKRLRHLSHTSTGYELELMSYATSLSLLSTVTHDRGQIDESIECYRLAIGLRDKDHIHKVTLYTNLGVALSRRYEYFGNLEDLHSSIDAHRDALKLLSAPYITAKRIAVASNLASVLMRLALTTPDESLIRDIEELFDLVYVSGSQVLPQSAFHLAINAARWARLRNQQEEAADHFQLALSIAYQLFRSQTLRMNKLSRIRDMRSLPAEAAFALGTIGDIPAAVTALEQGRALLFSDSLERKHVQLNSLVQDGHQDLVNSYHRAAAVIESLIRQAGHTRIP